MSVTGTILQRRLISLTSKLVNCNKQAPFSLIASHDLDCEERWAFTFNQASDLIDEALVSSRLLVKRTRPEL
jgi:hypothetical protein